MFNYIFSEGCVTSKVQKAILPSHNCFISFVDNIILRCAALLTCPGYWEWHEGQTIRLGIMRIKHIPLGTSAEKNKAEQRVRLGLGGGTGWRDEGGHVNDIHGLAPSHIRDSLTPHELSALSPLCSKKVTGLSQSRTSQELLVVVIISIIHVIMNEIIIIEPHEKKKITFSVAP